MTNEQRKAVALEYLHAFDNGGVTSTGGSILDLFAPDAQVYFPKWGLATGREQIGKLFADVGGTIKSISHHYAEFNWIFSGSDLVVCEGTSHGEHADGPWKAGNPEWGAGRWCDVFEIRSMSAPKSSVTTLTRMPILLRSAWISATELARVWLSSACRSRASPADAR